MKKFDYYRPAGLGEPEVCVCGHYSYVHGLYGCIGWARAGYTWRGRVNLSLLGMRFGVSLRCPCSRAWRNGELLPIEQWERMI